MLNIKNKNQRGDTIVEVLIALTVLMVVIAGGYSIATRSLNGARIAQERSEATKLAEGQLEAISERIKRLNGRFDDIRNAGFIGYDSSDSTDWSKISLYDSYKTAFCVKGDGSAAVQSDAIDFLTECKFGLYSVNTSTSVDFLGYDTANPHLDKKQLSYKVVVTWDKSGGGTQEKIELVGRYIIQ